MKTHNLRKEFSSNNVIMKTSNSSSGRGYHQTDLELAMHSNFNLRQMSFVHQSSWTVFTDIRKPTFRQESLHVTKLGNCTNQCAETFILTSSAQRKLFRAPSPERTHLQPRIIQYYARCGKLHSWWVSEFRDKNCHRCHIKCPLPHNFGLCNIPSQHLSPDKLLLLLQ